MKDSFTLKADANCLVYGNDLGRTFIVPGSVQVTIRGEHGDMIAMDDGNGQFPSLGAGSYLYYATGRFTIVLKEALKQGQEIIFDFEWERHRLFGAKVQMEIGTSVLMVPIEELQDVILNHSLKQE